MLGHASAAMTLDIYADLFDDDLDLVASALGRARAEMVLAVTETRPTKGRKGHSTRALGPSLKHDPERL